MRNIQHCPICGFSQFYVVDQMKQPDLGSSNVVNPLYAVAAAVDGRPLGLNESTRWRAAGGTFQAWICRKCGRTEMFVDDPEQALEKLSAIPGSGVRIVSTTPTGYR